MTRGRRRAPTFAVAVLMTVLVGGMVVGLILLANRSQTGSPAQSPNTPSSGGLVEEPARYDGTTVTFTGEAVGEAMKRGEHAWLHLNDDAYYLQNTEEGAALGGYNSGMPVWISFTLAEKVHTFGDYKHEGDVVTVQGVFNAACAEHGGDTDIHATTLDVVSPGHTVDDPVKVGKMIWALGLSVFAALLYVANRRVSIWGGRWSSSG